MDDFIRIIDDDFDEEVEFLRKLIRCNSERAEPVTAQDGTVYPFGQGVEDAYQLVMSEGERMGFATCDADHYGGHVEYGNGSRVMGILAHLDVVPAGDGWSFEPYSGAVDGGYIYGRGTTDDKGPLVASLFAMRALKKAGYEPSARVRLVLGLDEETEWTGMERYIQDVGPCDYGFTPDADFPVVNGEKGILTFDLVRKLQDRKLNGLELTQLSGGAAHNMVADKAYAVINASDPALYGTVKDKLFRYKTTHAVINGFEPKISVRGIGRSLKISVEGKSAHGAHPQLGLNAVSVLMEILGLFSFASEDVNDVISFYNDNIGYDPGGERLGCAFRDDVSGMLTLNVGVVAYDRKSITFTINVRYPINRTADDVYRAIARVTDRYGIGTVRKSQQEPIYFDPESRMIKTFMETYQEFTGDTESKPETIGGGTYARSMKNIVAFGALFPGDPDLMHQRDERLELDHLKTATKIYAQTIYKLTQEGFEF